MTIITPAQPLLSDTFVISVLAVRNLKNFHIVTSQEPNAVAKLGAAVHLEHRVLLLFVQLC